MVRNDERYQRASPNEKEDEDGSTEASIGDLGMYVVCTYLLMCVYKYWMFLNKLPIVK